MTRRPQHAATTPEYRMVFQEPTESLNPRLRLGASVEEPLLLVEKMSPADRRIRVEELFEMVRIDPRHSKSYPHQLSGGELQRICIARAIATSARSGCTRRAHFLLRPLSAKGGHRSPNSPSRGTSALVPLHFSRSHGREGDCPPRSHHVPGQNRGSRFGEADLPATASSVRHGLALICLYPRSGC